MRAIDGHRAVAAAKASFQTSGHFWSDDPDGWLGGLEMIGTDTRIERVWNLSAGQPGPTGMLSAYLIAEHAEQLAAVPEVNRLRWVRAEIERFLPALRGRVLAAHLTMWQEDPFAGGCFGAAASGQLREFLPTARMPDGRVHFAGEHTSVSVGWMDGALESGERAAAEIAERSTS